MTDEQLDDLKQFITVTVSQSETNIKHELRGEMHTIREGLYGELSSEIGGLRTEMREGFATIGDLITTHNDMLDNHEQCLTKLGAKAV
jgi:hypothetical protein